MNIKSLTRREFLRYTALAGVGLAAGCVPITPAASTTPPAGSAAGPTAAPQAVPAATTAAAAAPKFGGTLRIGIPADTRSLDPMNGPAGIEEKISSTAADPLFRFDEQGIPRPVLVTDFKSSPDFKSMTLTLRKGVKFHDGTEMTGAAVKLNLERMKSAGRAPFPNIKEVNVPDDYTVQIDLTEPDNGFVSDMGSFVLAGGGGALVTSPAAFKEKGADWLTNHIVGNGPFKFVSWQRDSVMKFERFDGYWGGKPYLDAVEWVVIADPMVASAAFQRGDLDVILQVPSNEAKNLMATGKYKAAMEAARVNGLIGDSAHPDSPFSDIRVRRAVSYAIDNKAIAESVGLGFFEATNQPAGPKTWTFNPQVTGYRYNPQKAKELLAEAGYSNGLKTKITGDSANSQWLTAVQEYLRKAGIDAELDLGTSARVSQVARDGWQNGLLQFSFGLAGGDPGATLRNVVTGSNYKVSLHPQEVNDLCAKIVAAPNFEAKKAVSQQTIAAIIDTYALWHPIFQYNDIALSYARVHDTQFYEIMRFWQPQKAWLDQ